MSATTGRNSYVDDQIVVDTSHADLVIQELQDELKVCATRKERDDKLGLTLLSLDGHEGYLKKLAAQRPDRRIVDGNGDAADPESDLDALLIELRAKFADRHGGWVPLVGKNRTIHTIGGYPYPESITRTFALQAVVDAGERQHLSVGAEFEPQVPERVTAESNDGRQVRVGVLDTVLYPHPNLDGRYIAPTGAIYRPRVNAVEKPPAGHATFTCDLILRQAPLAELVVRAGLNREEGTASVWTIAKKMVLFADAGIDVLNLSFGCHTRDGQPPLVLQRAIELLTPNTVIVAAAGNHGNSISKEKGKTSNSPTWPAAHHDVVAVGAHRPTDPYDVADFSPKAPWIQFTAPGVNVTAAFIEAKVITHANAEPIESCGRAQWSGTSFAAATVTGVIAAMTKPGRRSAKDVVATLSGGRHSTVKRYQHSERSFPTVDTATNGGGPA